VLILLTCFGIAYDIVSINNNIGQQTDKNFHLGVSIIDNTDASAADNFAS
jgi:hypothetical protein